MTQYNIKCYNTSLSEKILTHYMQLVTFKTAHCKPNFFCFSSILIGPAALSFNRTLSVTCLFVRFPGVTIHCGCIFTAR